MRWAGLRRIRLRTWAIGGAALLAAAGAALLWAWTRQLPAFDTLRDYRPLAATRVLAPDGREVFAFARERRTVVPMEQIPEVLRKAVLAAEDARFYQHEGLNYLAILRCAAKDLWRRGVACGGSTITQQVVKTFLLSNEWKVKRKVKELVLAPRLERNLSKDEILWLYLNQIYLGHRRYGVEEASRFYFGKGVKDLGLGEAALLAGLVQSPERLSPVKHPAAAKERQRYVLRRMVEEGFVGRAQAEAEAARPILVAPPEADPPGASYADAVRRYLDDRYGADAVETEGLTVEVAMDPRLQRAAERAVEDDLRAVDRRQGYRGPLARLPRAERSAALAAWREKLAAARSGRDEVVVWDLAGLGAAALDAADAAPPGGSRPFRIRPLVAGEIYGGLVTAAGDRTATVDLGGATGTLALADLGWARRWNPTSPTPAPRRVSAVVAPGDVVLVRVAPGPRSPAELARAHRPLALSLEQRPLVQGALVALDPATREVRALVGGHDLVQSQFNRAIQARRQPGSAFKPFVWGAAIESRRFTPATLVYDTPDVYRDPWTGKAWKPHNFERDEFDGPMLLQAALAHSKNTVSVKLVDALGVEQVIAFARRMGIESEEPRNLTLALGTGEVTPLELTNAYATIDAGGRAAAPVLVLRVTDRDGKVLEAWRPGAPPTAPPAAIPPVTPPAPSPPSPALDSAAAVPVPVPAPAPDAAGPAAPPPAEFTIPATGTRPDVAFVLTAMMRGVVEYGTGTAAQALGRPVAAKTGTAQDHRDAWFVGFTPELVTGVWVGFDDHAPLGPHETGAGAALPAWLDFMEAALGALPPAEFEPPAGVERVRVDPASGLRIADPPAGVEAPPPVPFLAGTAPAEAPSSRAPPPPQGFFQDDR